MPLGRRQGWVRQAGSPSVLSHRRHASGQDSHRATYHPDTYVVYVYLLLNLPSNSTKCEQLFPLYR